MNFLKNFSIALFALLATVVTASPRTAVAKEEPKYDYILTKRAATATTPRSVDMNADVVRDISRYIDIIPSESGSSSDPDDQAIIDIHHFTEHKVDANTGEAEDWFSDPSIDRSINLDINELLTESFMYGQQSLFNKSSFNFNKSIGANRLLPAYIDLNIDTYFASGKNIELFIIPRQRYEFSPVVDLTVSFSRLAEFGVSVFNALTFPLDMEILNLPFLVVDGQIKGMIQFRNDGQVSFVCDPKVNISFSKNSNSLKLEMPQQNYIKDIQFLSLIQSNSTKTIAGVDIPTYVGGSPYTTEFYSVDNNYTPESLLKTALATYETRPNKIIDFNIKERTFQVKSSILIENVIFREADYYQENDYYQANLTFTHFDGFIFANQDPATGNKQLTRDPVYVALSGDDYVKRDYFSEHIITTYNMPDSLFENAAQFIVVNQLNYHLMTRSDIYYLSSSFMYSKFELKFGSKVDVVYGRVRTVNDWLNGWKILIGKYHSDQVHNVYLYHNEERTIPVRNILDIEMHYQVGATRNTTAPKGEGSNSFSVEDGEQVYFNPLHSSTPLSFTHNLVELSDVELAHSIAPISGGSGIFKIMGTVMYGALNKGPYKTYLDRKYTHYNDLQQVTMDLDGSSTGDYARVNKKYGITKDSGVIEDVNYWNEINEITNSAKPNIPQVVFYNSIPMRKDDQYYVNWMAPAAIHYVSAEERSVVPGSFWSDGRHIEFLEDGITPIGVFDQFGNLIEDLKPTLAEDGNYVITDHDGNYKEPDNVTVTQKDKNIFDDFLKGLRDFGKTFGIVLGVVLILVLIVFVISLFSKNKVIIKTGKS